MARDRHKGGRERAVSTLEGRPKALRRELSDLETELERARRRRDRAQARVEALEAIAEQLAVALAAAEAARERRRNQREATAGEESAAGDVGSTAPTAHDAPGPDPSGERDATDGLPRPASEGGGFADDRGGAVATATARGTQRAKSARTARAAS